MDLTVINDQGQQVTSVAASDETFGRDYNEALDAAHEKGIRP